MDRNCIVRDDNIFVVESFYETIDNIDKWYVRVELNGDFSEWEKIPSEIIDRSNITEKLIENLLKNKI